MLDATPGLVGIRQLSRLDLDIRNKLVKMHSHMCYPLLCPAEKDKKEGCGPDIAPGVPAGQSIVPNRPVPWTDLLPLPTPCAFAC